MTLDWTLDVFSYAGALVRWALWGGGGRVEGWVCVSCVNRGCVVGEGWWVWCGGGGSAGRYEGGGGASPPPVIRREPIVCGTFDGFWKRFWPLGLCRVAVSRDRNGGPP